jgi:hypothetical protein
MKRQKTNVIDLGEFRVPASTNYVLGRLTDVTPQGVIMVDYPGNMFGPLPARFVSVLGHVDQAALVKDGPVLLIFENADARLPIVVGTVMDTLPQTKTIELKIPDKATPKDVCLDKKKVVFEAQEQIELRCGKCSVSLTKQGKIVIKGIEIVSRAARTNKIKGASVSIN